MTIYTWTGGAGDGSWSESANWSSQPPGGIPGVGDIAEVPATDVPVGGFGEETFTIETGGAEVGTFYGASIGFFPVYNSALQYEYTGEVPSVAVLQGGLTADNLYGVILDGGNYTVSGNAGSPVPNYSIGFQELFQPNLLGRWLGK